MNYIYTSLKNNLTKRVTIFSIPKAFVGHVGIIQRNAILSWTLLTPKPEIFLFGNELGTKEICQNLNLIHIPEIQRNKYSTPLLDGVFAEIHERASNNIIAYVNSDLILTNDFYLAIQTVSKELDDYLLIGRRWNIDLSKKLKFDLGWESSLDKLIGDKGYLANIDCKDYFVFPKHLFANIPAFAVGRGYWDTWMVIQALADGYPVVDASLVVTAIHQNHPYTHIRGGRNEAYMGREAQINKTLGNVTQPGDISRATWQLKPKEYEYLPTVSVVIVVREGEMTVEKAVLSVLVQDYQDYEIIIINNGSSGKLKPILKPYEDRIRYFSLEKQEDVNSYSYGIKVARGEFLTFLDGSSVLLLKTLREQVACFENESSTLDILLSGYKIVSEDKAIEYQPSKDLPTYEDLQPEKLNLVTKPLDEYAIMIRASRLNLIIDAKQQCDREMILAEAVYSLIYSKKCKANSLNIVTQIRC